MTALPPSRSLSGMHARISSRQVTEEKNERMRKEAQQQVQIPRSFAGWCARSSKRMRAAAVSVRGIVPQPA